MKIYQARVISFINKTLYQPLNNLERVPQILDESDIPYLMKLFHQGDYKQKWVIFQIFEKMGPNAKSVIPELSDIVIETAKTFNKIDFGSTITDLENLDYCEEIIELIKKLKES